MLADVQYEQCCTVDYMTTVKYGLCCCFEKGKSNVFVAK